MKILFYIHAVSGGGGERVLATLANEFVLQGMDVHLATRLDEPFAYNVDDAVTLHDLYESCDSPSRLLNSLRLRRNMRRIAKTVKPDVIVAFMAAMGCSVIFSTAGLGIPVIVCEHTNVLRFISHSLNIKRKVLYPFASAVTVLTMHDYDILKKRLSHVEYMPNPIRMVEFPADCMSRRKVVLAVGRVSQWEVKGFDNLIRCWGQICHDFPDWKLEIAGEADEESKSYLGTLVQECNCKNVEFLGFRKDVEQLMISSQVFCLSSRVEGLPMALLEAMNCGCCCVSFDVVTGPRDIIDDKVSGLIARNQDNDDLVCKLSAVLADEALRCSLARQAQSSVEKYSIEHILERWNVLLDKVAYEKIV